MYSVCEFCRGGGGVCDFKKQLAAGQRRGEGLADLTCIGEAGETGADKDVDDVGGLPFGAVEVVGADLVELLHAPRPHNGGNAAQMLWISVGR